MEKVKRFFGNLSERKANQIVFFVVSMLCLGIIYFSISGVIEWKNQKERIQREKIVFDKNLYSEIEVCAKEDGEIALSGWAIKKDAIIEMMYIVLKGEEENKVYRVKRKERRDVVNYFFQDEATKEYGFELKIEKEEIDNESCYEVLLYLCYQENKIASEKKVQTEQVNTEKYIYQQEILTYNPKEYHAPYLGEKYAKVIQDGIVRDYDVANQYWVYQYETKLYYFVGKRTVEINDGKKLCIPVMPATSVVELLPENRRQYGNDHLGAFLLDNIYINDNGEGFYTQIVELPTQYPITYICTGLYDDTEKEWITNSYIPMFEWRAYK